MRSVDVNYRVLYADTDAMGIVYYANYLRFYEIGRDAYLRAINMSGEDLKKDGVIFPAISVNMRYLIPAELNDEIIIKTRIIEIPQVRLLFRQSVHHHKKGMLNEADITLATVDASTMRPRRCPVKLQKAVDPTLG
ncbi:MAG: YbgC/FadM family acyl-CoA thioesterase [Bacteroidota bacterium]